MKAKHLLVASMLAGCLSDSGGEAIDEEEACTLASEFVEDSTWYLPNGEVAEDAETLGCEDFLSDSEEGIARIRVEAEYEFDSSTEDLELDCYLDEWDQGWEVSGCAPL